MLVPMQQYDERLHVPRGWWLIGLLGAALLGVALLPLGLVPLLAGLAAGSAAGGVALSAYGSVRIRVVGDTLVAGQARIPLSALGRAQELDAAQALAWRTHRADARAHLLLRSYVPTAVRVEVTDPADPTPYLYLSTRRPRRLVAALEDGGTGTERPDRTARPTPGTAEHRPAGRDPRGPALGS
jgi:hypothetical protein